MDLCLNYRQESLASGIFYVRFCSFYIQSRANALKQSKPD